MTSKNYLLTLLFFGSASAQVKDSLRSTVLETVYISTLHLNDSLLHAPASVGLLSSSQLQQNNHSDISAAMNTLPGVHMQSSNFTTNRISIRGIGARTPYGTNKIRAFYGNIPLTSGDSETTIDDIDLENMQQIEVIKGPLSSIYGAGLGGAILISPASSERKSVNASFTHGSFGLLKNRLNVNLGRQFAINYHKLQTDGWRENSAYKREGFTITGELFRKPNSKLRYLGSYTWLKAFIPSSIDRKTFDENPKAAAATWLASKGYKEYRSVLGGLAYEFRINKNLSNNTSVFINYKDNYETRPFDILRQYTFASGARTQFLGEFNVAKVPANFIIGAEYFNDDYHGRTLQNLYKFNNGNGSLEGGLLTANTQQRNFYNAFAQLRLQFSKKMELQTGINANKTNFRLNNDYPTTDAVQKYRYDAIWSPQLSFLFKPSQLQTIYISASRGFSIPSVSETLTASGTINASIKPESGTNYEVGGKFYFFGRKLYTEIAVFRMDIKDLLVAKRIGDDQYVGINAGETLHQGVEFSVSHLWQFRRLCTLNSYVSASIGEYRFDSFVDGGNDFSGNKLTGVAANKVNAGFALKTPSGWYLNADLLFVDKMPLNDANSVSADAYKIVNARTGYRFDVLPKLEADATFGMNNIGNEHYTSLILPNALPVGNNTPRYYYPGLPVNYYFHFSLNYSL